MNAEKQFTFSIFAASCLMRYIMNVGWPTFVF